MDKITVNGKVVATLDDAGVFRKKIVESKHLMKNYGGVPCFDADTHDRYSERITEINVLTDKHRIFKTSARVFNENKGEFDFGHGRQYFVGIKHWEILNTREQKLV